MSEGLEVETSSLPPPGVKFFSLSEAYKFQGEYFDSPPGIDTSLLSTPPNLLKSLPASKRSKTNFTAQMIGDVDVWRETLDSFRQKKLKEEKDTISLYGRIYRVNIRKLEEKVSPKLQYIQEFIK
eukprot:g5672.t1